jgi:hypothetical protein
MISEHTHHCVRSAWLEEIVQFVRFLEADLGSESATVCKRRHGCQLLSGDLHLHLHVRVCACV